MQAHKDLADRAFPGIFIYTVVWLIVSIWAGVPEKSPMFFSINTAIMIIIAILRLIHYRGIKKYSESYSQTMYRFLVGLILFSALHWGLLSAWIIWGGDYNDVHYPFMVILAAFAIGGTSVLCVSRTIAFLFPAFIFFPTIIVGLIVFQTTEHLVLAGLAIISMCYIYPAAKLTHNNYWQGLYNHKLVQDRALEMELLSITDQLTGLNNRMYFNNKFNEEWQRCHRSKVPFSLLLMDLDHFKKINDAYGHIMGDECLKKVAVVLKTEIKRLTDTVARYGGEEFVIILPNTDIEASEEVADRVLKSIREIDLEYEGQKIKVTCSIGLAHAFPNEDMDRHLVLKQADDVLYQAKQQGRDRYVTFKNESN